MEHVTQAEIEAFILQARAAYPQASVSDAVWQLAMTEAREACERLGLTAKQRTSKVREFRDKI